MHTSSIGWSALSVRRCDAPLICMPSASLLCLMMLKNVLSSSCALLNSLDAKRQEVKGSSAYPRPTEVVKADPYICEGRLLMPWPRRCACCRWRCSPAGQGLSLRLSCPAACTEH